MGTKRHFRVWRGDSAGGETKDYDVEVNDGEVVLDIIHRLQATQTPDLACRWNCKAGKCGSCSMEINGMPRLGCMTRMSTFEETETITITPLRTFPVIRDLVTDVTFNYEKARQTPAFAPPVGVKPGDYRMQQVDVERSQEFRKCIECFLCQNTCHVVRDHEENKPAFSGPRYFIRAAELDMHPLDARTDRKAYAQANQGLGYCNITKCCTEVCPEHIKITDNAIIPMKERVVDRRYDPLVWLGRKIFRRDQLEEQPSLAPSAPAAGQRSASGAGTSQYGGQYGGGGDMISNPPEQHEPGSEHTGLRRGELATVGADGKMDISELIATNQGGPSPFGDELEFPMSHTSYVPPAQSGTNSPPPEGASPNPEH
jgi:succinate dehydrogenase / fumarate reductase iron-sulfur subunit